MIAIAGYRDSSQSVAEEVAELKELGLAGLKLKVGSRALEDDAARVREAREAGGADFVLAADANQVWTREEAVRFARLVEDQGLVWLEEPCRWDNDRRALRDVRAGARVPVCAGQSELSARGCLDLMLEGAIDVCNFDSSWSGGPTEWRRAAAAALVLGISMGHHEEPQIASHLLASIPHGTYVECFHPDRDPVWWNLVANRPPLVDGTIELTDAPGLGWELDLDYLRGPRRWPTRRGQAMRIRSTISSSSSMPRPGPVGTCELAVAQLERRGQDAVDERRVGDRELRPRRPVEDRDELERRGDEHAGREAVRHDLDRAAARELARSAARR